MHSSVGSVPKCFSLTIAIDDVNNPYAFRLTFDQPNNSDFPSTVSREFLSCMQNGTTYYVQRPGSSGTIRIPTNWSELATLITGNPVASAFMYKQFLYLIMSILICWLLLRRTSLFNQVQCSKYFLPINPIFSDACW